MASLMAWGQGHWMTVLALAWLFSAVVGHLPAPAQGGNKAYAVAYPILHGIAGNIPQALGKLFPQYATTITKLFGGSNA